jgi:hypothetical protein
MELKFKKGFFFTAISLVIISVLFLMLKPSMIQSDLEDISVVQSRVLSLNDFVKELRYDYIPKAILVSSREALKSYSQYIKDNNFESQANMSKNIYSLITYGNLSEIAGIKNNYSLSSLLNNISETVRLKHIDVNFTFNDKFDIYQDNSTGPWKLGINLSMNYTIKTSNMASWNRTDQEFNVQVYIDNLPDAYFYLNTNRSERNITQAINLTWNYDNFKNHIENKTYAWSNFSPSFLNRLTNNSDNSSCCGIHTIIGNGSEYKVNGDLGGYNNKSFVDFCYFSNKCNDLSKTEGISSDFVDDGNYTYPFRIDGHYIIYYRISQNSTSIN